MAYTLANLQSDIRSYTEVGASVLSDAILTTIIKNSENGILRSVPTDQNAHYATSNLIINNRYVTIPDDLRSINYAQLTDSSGNQLFLEQRDPSFMAEYYSTPSTSAVGIPKYYGNWDENFWVVAPTPDTNYSITMAYNREPFSITDTTNPIGAPANLNGTYLSNKYQDLLLYGSLVNTYGYLKGPSDMIQYYQGLYQNALTTYATEQIGYRRRDEDEDGILRQQLKSKSPSAYGTQN
jgi:hypothetical protein|tara:strand:+ start:1165 stop:1878 length:714 start_codon:yes stop_codon:yes gene_type:complete